MEKTNISQSLLRKEINDLKLRLEKINSLRKTEAKQKEKLKHEALVKIESISRLEEAIAKLYEEHNR
jgi:hypothetical protein